MDAPLAPGPQTRQCQDPEAEKTDRVETVYFRDASRSAITSNKSPDIGFDASVIPPGLSVMVQAVDLSSLRISLPRVIST